MSGYEKTRENVESWYTVAHATKRRHWWEAYKTKQSKTGSNVTVTTSALRPMECVSVTKYRHLESTLLAGKRAFLFPDPHNIKSAEEVVLTASNLLFIKSSRRRLHCFTPTVSFAAQPKLPTLVPNRSVFTDAAGC